MTQREKKCVQKPGTSEKQDSGGRGWVGMGGERDGRGQEGLGLNAKQVSQLSFSLTFINCGAAWSHPQISLGVFIYKMG